jgi:hypothetical protein
MITHSLLPPPAKFFTYCLIRRPGLFQEKDAPLENFDPAAGFFIFLIRQEDVK